MEVGRGKHGSRWGKKDPRLGVSLGIEGLFILKGEGAQLALGIWFPTLCGECGATNQVQEASEGGTHGLSRAKLETGSRRVACR